MNISTQIKHYIESQDESKIADFSLLHEHILQMFPSIKLWYFDGIDATGKVVSNPSFGYGKCLLNYKDGSSREFYRIGISGNTTGISIYIMGIDDKNYLQNTFADKIGKAKVTSYCIKFKALKEIKIDVLFEAIHFGIGLSKSNS